MSVPTESSRPTRWDKPYSADMTDADVDRLLSIAPLSQIDPNRFRSSLSLRDILKNDARLIRCQPGDIVIRKGDWGNTAYLVLSGTMRVELDAPERCMPPEMLGRRKVEKKNVFQALAQWWSNHRSPEVRQPVTSPAASGVGTRGTGERTRIYLEDVGVVLNSHRTAALPAGQFFGEIAALGRTQRVATVFAETETELLEIRWQGLRDIMRNDPAVRQHIDQLFRQRALSAFLRDTPMFRHVSDDEMKQLVAAAEFHSFGQLDVARPARQQAKEGQADLSREPIIATEGDYPNGVYLVRSGLARLSQQFHHGHLTVGYLTPGHVYGFDAIAAEYRPLKYSLRAIGYLAVVFVPSHLIDTFVLRRERRTLRVDTPQTAQVAILPKVEPQVPEIRLGQIPAADAPALNQDLIEFFVERRFIIGTAAMIIDTDRCTRCDDCIRACANAHDNNPRFIRHGPRHGHFMVANACLHCADPVCMIECPTGAIHRREAEGQVVINDDTCIGCTQCANNCPFNAIRMVEIRDERGRLRLDAKNRRIFQATKCDLCADQLGGPACQNACPHDALRRIDMRNLAAISEMVNR